MALKVPSREQPAPVDFSGQPIITVRNLTKEFDEVVAVDDLSFDIPEGVIFGFIGPSGSGKTTTIRLMTGVYAPTSGDITVLGYKPSEFPRSLRNRIGYMPQLYFLYPQLTVWENMNFAASLYGIPFIKRKYLHDLLEFVELTGHENKMMENLSGGMRRRLSLAATLVPDSTLVFLDEPTAGIDPVLRRKFWDHFQGMKQSGKTMFITTQYVGEVSYCDLVGVMSEGRLIMVDSPDNIRHRTYGGDIVDISTEQYMSEQIMRDVQQLPFVRDIVSMDGKHIRMIVQEARDSIPDLMEWFNHHSVKVESIEEYLPPYDDVFVELIQQREQEV